MSAIFISHSSKDKVIAAEVKAKLLEQGHRSIFLDFDPEDGIPTGRNWEKELYARLRGCQAVIVLCSEHSMASPWCFAEITQARSLGKHLFPLKIDACQISPLLSDVQVTDLTLNPTEGYQRLWFGLKKVGLDPRDLFDWDGTRPPYPGLLAFQEQDAAVYFGRDAARQGTMEILNRLQRLGGARLVLVLGASGSGKSSLVRAGVIPRLKRDKDRWLVLEAFRPLGRPFDGLAMVLAGAFASSGDARDWKSIRDALNPAADHTGDAPLLDLANDVRIAAGRREATVLLVVDQFEELLGRDTDQSASLFLRLLKAVLSQPSSPFLAVATLRSDFLGAFQTHEAVQDLLYEPIHLPQMALADFAQVIEGPAKVAGIELEAGLAQAMVADTATDDALPLLAFTLRELWDRYSGDGRLTLEEYRDRLGGLQGSLARAAGAIFAERPLSADEELHLRKAFLSMVRVDEEGRYVRRPAPWKELPEDVHDLLERFVQARLLVSGSEGAERILEVAHEALFRSWDRLVAWLSADREFLLWRQRRQGDMAEWERNDHDESMLLRGPALAEAERWLGERADDLIPAERGFIEASVALREQERAARERFRRRNRLIALGMIGILSIAALFAGWQWWRAEEQRQFAEVALSRQLAARAAKLVEDDQPVPAMLVAVEGLPDDKAGREERHWPFVPEAEFALSEAWKVNSERAVLKGHQAEVWWVAFDPHYSRAVTASFDNTARLWNADSGAEVAVLRGHAHRVYYATFDASGTRVVTASEDRTARIWDVASGRLLHVLKGHAKGVWQALFDPTGRIIVTVSDDGTARLWDSKRGEPLRVLRGHESGVVSAAFTHAGDRLVTASKDRTARLWDVETGQPIAILAPHGKRVMSVVFNPQDTQIVTASDDSRARVWSAKTGQLIWELSGHTSAVHNAAFNQSGTLIVTASEDRTGRIWQSNSGKELVKLQGHEGAVESAAFDASGTRIITSSADGTARVWDTKDGKPRFVLKDHKKRILAVAFNGIGTRLITASDDHTARLWTLEDFKPIATLRHPQNSALTDVAFDPSGARIVTASWEGTSHLWNADTGALLHTLNGHRHNRPIRSASFDARGEHIVTASDDGTARLWRAETGEPIGFLGHGSPVAAAAFNLEGNLVVTGDNTNTARLWDAARGIELPPSYIGHASPVTGVAFDPSGTRVVTASWDQTARVWDAKTRKQLLLLNMHKAPLSSAVFSPDGKRIVTASWDDTARIWDAQTGKPLVNLVGPRSLVMGAAFDESGSRVVTASLDKTARVWDAESGKLLATIKGHTGPVWKASFNSSSTRIVTASSDGTAKVWRVFPSTQAFVDHVKATVPRCLTPSERLAFQLPVEPPVWCVEMGKWPYMSGAWRQWLANGKSGKMPRMPEAVSSANEEPTHVTGDLVFPERPGLLVTTSFEQMTNRPGVDEEDYKHFNLARADPRRCQLACLRDLRCKAWTYVKSDLQGPARCWLKDNEPPARQGHCCISGVKREVD